VAAGRRILEAEGFDGLTMQRVAMAVGVRAPSLYKRIPSRGALLGDMANDIAENVEFHSGHGGLAFVYDPWRMEPALDAIYASARRFWGIDIEDLNHTLPLMKSSIKGVSWITLVGSEFASKPQIEPALRRADTIPEVTVERHRHGVVMLAGSEPVVGDQNRPDRTLDPYYAVANLLRPLFLMQHPDFPSERFVKNGNTTGWIRRFIEPDGWR
jgi:AcrR family transcriptional regulator